MRTLRLGALAGLVISGCSGNLAERAGLVSPAGTNRINTQHVYQSHDRFKDATTWSTEPILIIGGPGIEGPMIHFLAAAIRNGSGHPTQPNVAGMWLAFRSVSKNWAFLKSREVDFLADGSRVNLGEARHDGDVSSGFGTAQVQEALVVPITMSQLRTLSGARKLEGRIGGLEFSPSESVYAVLQRFTVVADSIGIGR